jgi:hypothetical protein
MAQASLTRGVQRFLSGHRIATHASLVVKRSIRTYQRASSPWKTAAVTVATSGAVLLVIATSTTSFFTSLEKEEEEKGTNEETFSYRIEVNFMEKLAKKSYLHFRDHLTRVSTSGGSNNSNEKGQGGHNRPPPGVPRTLRILAVDLPEMRDAFCHGKCQLQADKVYPDGVAPDRVVHVPNQGQGTTTTTTKSSSSSSSTTANKEDGIQLLHVEQKSWVTSMVQCVADGTESVGVQILEANTGAQLNPHNLRRTRQFGTLKYDPGKYATINRKQSVVATRARRATTKKEKTQTNNDLEVDVAPILAAPEDELAAPWNQHAWMEEMELRISGQVEFGAPLEVADKWSRYMYGTTFKSTVPSSRSVWAWLSPFAKTSSSNDIAGAGMDGLDNTWASNKPHAVIANGAALQLVPNSLRLLQNACRDHHVPLYVVQDPRVWGGNTHNDLGDVLRDLRKTVKSRIVAASLQQAVGTAFQRGRWVGKLESDTKWQTVEAIRKTKDTVQKTKETIRSATGARKVKEEMDWRQLDEIALEKELARRGVIQREKKTRQDEAPGRTYTGGMIALAKRCVTDQQRDTKSKETTEALAVAGIKTETDHSAAPAPQSV